jgi:hypothetical protein
MAGANDDTIVYQHCEHRNRCTIGHVCPWHVLSHWTPDHGIFGCRIITQIRCQIFGKIAKF